MMQCILFKRYTLDTYVWQKIGRKNVGFWQKIGRKNVDFGKRSVGKMYICIVLIDNQQYYVQKINNETQGVENKGQ